MKGQSAKHLSDSLWGLWQKKVRHFRLWFMFILHLCMLSFETKTPLKYLFSTKPLGFHHRTVLYSLQRFSIFVFLVQHTVPDSDPVHPFLLLGPDNLKLSFLSDKNYPFHKFMWLLLLPSIAFQTFSWSILVFLKIIFSGKDSSSKPVLNSCLSVSKEPSHILK